MKWFKLNVDDESLIVNKSLSMQQRGIIFTNLMLYANGKELVSMDEMETFVFNIMSNRVDDCAIEYAKTCQRNIENGRKGGRPKTQKTQ